MNLFHFTNEQASNASILVTLFVGLATIITTLAVTYFTRKKKQLSYEVLTKASLIQTYPALRPHLEIKYDNQEINSLTIIEIKIQNSGKEVIKPEDVYENISFPVSKKSRIVSYSIIKKHPDNLDVKVLDSESSDRRVVISPCLLNESEWFTIQLSVDNLTAEIKPEARISGIKEIKRYIRRPLGITSKPFLLYIFGFFGLSISTFYFNSTIVFLGFTVFENMVLSYVLFRAWKLKRYGLAVILSPSLAILIIMTLIFVLIKLFHFSFLLK